MRNGGALSNALKKKTIHEKKKATREERIPPAMFANPEISGNAVKFAGCRRNA